MVSLTTGERYDDIYVSRRDLATGAWMTPDGEYFRQLPDGTWDVVRRDGSTCLVRYRCVNTHAAGVVMNPMYELIGERWHHILTGRPASFAS